MIFPCHNSCRSQRGRPAWSLLALVISLLVFERTGTAQQARAYQSYRSTPPPTGHSFAPTELPSRPASGSFESEVRTVAAQAMSGPRQQSQVGAVSSPDPVFAAPAPVLSTIEEAPVSQAATPLAQWRDSHEDPWIGVDTPFTSSLLDFQNQQSEKQLWLLEHAAAGTGPRVTIGAQFRATAMYAHTNSADKFNYMGRFPPDFSGTDASDARLLQANQDLVAHAGEWVTGYAETLFSDVFTFPTFNQGSFQMRQAYVAVGNLNESPFYGFIGKKNVSFGNFTTLSPFSQSMPWHYFAPLGEGAGVGFANSGFELTATALNGSRGIRVMDSSRRGHLNNFAANGSYTANWGDDLELRIGGGYLHGTIYDSTVAEHTVPAITGERNPAWDANVGLRLGRWLAIGEYVQTFNEWPVVGHVVQAYQTELAYEVDPSLAPLRLSVSWSEGIQGPDGATFQFNRQLVTGARWTFSQNVFATLEYIRGTGFAPLINITTVSDPDVTQHTILAGLVVAI